MKKGKLRSGIAMVLVATMAMLLFTACGQKPKQDAAPQSAEEAYAAFLQEQNGDGDVYAAIVTASEDGAPVLLIGTETMEMAGTTQAIAADVYGYVDGQVVKICGVESTSTAYPIGTVEGKYLVCGSHHDVKRYLVSGSEANVEILKGLAMEETAYTMTTGTIANDEMSGEEVNEISTEDGDAFAEAIYAGWEPIEFTKCE